VGADQAGRAVGRGVDVSDEAVTPELVTYEDEIGMDRLQRRPIIERVDQRQLELIRKSLALAEGDQQITNAELGHFLELCALYGLDPFAREAWIAKSKSGKLLIMVGRAGLRKIVDRNGLKMSSAVVHSKDQFEVEYIDAPDPGRPGEWEAWGSAPYHRVTHRFAGMGDARGVIAGAWARVREVRTGREMGFFNAPLSEYMPVNVSSYSPWSKQTSAMMRGAVERQAASEATPLGGLLAEGENESADAPATIGASDGEGPGWGEMPGELVGRVMNVIDRAHKLGHAGLSDEPTIQQRLNGQPVAVVVQWLADARATLDAAEPPDADVVERLALTFGGETFEFDSAGDGSTYALLSACMGDKAAMLDTARKLDAEPSDGEWSARWHAMAVALVREAAGINAT
jgi:hypothetical protein